MKLSLRIQFLLTCLLLMFTIILFEMTPIDLMVQENFYNFSDQQWVIDRHQSMLKFIFYDGIKKLIIAFVLGLLVLLIVFRNHPRLKPYMKGLIIVIVSCVSVAVSINYLKSISNTACPKHIKYFHGEFPYIKVLDEYADNAREPFKCWPAGHASGGFALLSLFFLFHTRRAKIISLVTSLFLGWSMGLYKMLIGDHFLSHTIIAMLMTWLIILLVVSLVETVCLKLDKGSTF